LAKEGAEKNISSNMCSGILEEQNKWRSEAIIWRIGHSNGNKKKGRLRWLGHVERMSEEREVKRLYQNTAEGSGSVGRPRLRWIV
jgi:hypothetical protein